MKNNFQIIENILIYIRNMYDKIKLYDKEKNYD